jgi:SAM-dependent methyltransferase
MDPVMGDAGKSNDLADREFWDKQWLSSHFEGLDLDNYYQREYFKLFLMLQRELADRQRVELIEVGCGNSAWLPFLNKHFHWQVTGIDFSQVGLERCRSFFQRQGAEGVLLQRDVFAENNDLQGRFDVVFSGGLLEHFLDPQSILEKMKRLAKPGAYFLNTVPNLQNFSLIWQKLIGAKTLAKHRVLTLAEMRRIHEAAGLSTVFCRYQVFGGIVVPDRDWWLTRAIVWFHLKSYGFCRRVFGLCGWPPPMNRRTGAVIAYCGKLP